MFTEWKSAFKNLDIGVIIGQVMDSRQKDLVGLNQDQLKKGQKSTGENLSNPYSKSHASKRRKRGLQTGHKDLLFSGDFHGGMYARADNVATEFGSDDDKEALMEWMEGDEIFSLTDESLNKFLYEMGGADDIVAKVTEFLTS